MTYICYALSKVFCSENVVSESSAVLNRKFGKSLSLIFNFKQKLQNPIYFIQKMCD